VTANRDLNARIESLKGDLIEYEDKYERCKRDCDASQKTVDELATKFAQLHNAYEAGRVAADDGDKALASRVTELQEQLHSSCRAREQLAVDVHSFEQTVAEFDNEVQKLRDSNRQLIEDNRSLRESVHACDSMRQVFDSTDEELSELRERLKEYQLETMRQELALRAHIEQLETENERLRTEGPAGGRREHRESVDAAAITEPSTELLDTIIRRYRTVVGEQAARIVEMRDIGECERWAHKNTCSAVGVSAAASLESTSSRSSTTNGHNAALNTWDRLPDIGRCTRRAHIGNATDRRDDTFTHCRRAVVDGCRRYHE
jgi:chromosome segregation ATPase